MLEQDKRRGAADTALALPKHVKLVLLLCATQPRQLYERMQGIDTLTHVFVAYHVTTVVVLFCSVL